jgi:hypothetical protein
MLFPGLPDTFRKVQLRPQRDQRLAIQEARQVLRSGGMRSCPASRWPWRPGTGSPSAAAMRCWRTGLSAGQRDVDLFTDQEYGVQAAAGAVEAALRDAGFAAERRDQAAGLADVFPGMGEGLAEWVVTAPDGAQMMLQMAYFDRGREPVVMEIGAVLDVEDVAGGKVCALAGRVEPETMPTPPRCWSGSVPRSCSDSPGGWIQD